MKKDNHSDKIELQEPITRGEAKIESITLRRPKSGELRGLNMTDLMQVDVSAVLTLIPRISEPPLTQPEANELDPVDLAAISGELRGFFMSKAELKAVQQMMGT